MNDPATLIGKILVQNIEYDNFASPFKLIYYFIIFIVILLLSYYLSKYVGGKVYNKNKIIKLVETFPLGRDKSLYIINLGEEFLLIGSSAKEVSLISKYSKEEFENIILNEEANIVDIYNERDLNKLEHNFKRLTNHIINFIKGKNR